VQAVYPQGGQVNVGCGPRFDLVDIGHPHYVAVVEADTAFWTLVPREQALDMVLGSDLPGEFAQRYERFQKEMQALRFGLTPSAVYFNPTERCNLNCPYCYLPEDMRRAGMDMAEADLFRALEILSEYFQETLPPDSVQPQVIFHGSEPMLRREVIFPAMEKYAHRFRFGIQTNATLLDDEALAFIRSREISLGISLDAHLPEINDRTRRTWGSKGVFGPVSQVLEKLAGYPNYSVMCTVTQANVAHLPEIVDFFHGHQVGVAMLNPVRCTQAGGRASKPDDAVLARHFIAALDRAGELYEQTGRRLVLANFANILIAITAPTARRLMCDISPCGGGRCFFAVAATGDLFPCSEFIGLPQFKGGNIFVDQIPAVLESPQFRRVSRRRVEDFAPCDSCVIRHFCGSPCPAEVYTTYGTMQAPAPYCDFYVEQVKYAFRIIADQRLEAYLWEGWNQGTEQIFGL